MIATFIGYRLKQPRIYNKGGEENWEFLFCYSNKTVEEVTKEVEELNATKPKTDRTGQEINWNEIDYLFVGEQEVFED